jgi:glyoxylase-like metal-dependent hydrolase (beta-lactamase superfamily II)
MVAAAHMKLALLVALTLAACKTIDHPSTVTPVPTAGRVPASWDEVFAAPADVTVDVVLSAHWKVPRNGVLDMNDPKARAAGKPRDKVPIVLPIGVVRHATKGDFVIDTGVERAMVDGERGARRGLLAVFLKSIDPVISLGEIIERDRLQLAGVLLTHMHIDHVLGLSDVPKGTPIWVGPGEPAVKQHLGGLMRRTFRELLRDHAPLRELPVGDGVALGPIAHAIDLLGDGSIWGLAVPGHTAGSMAWLVNAKAGPVLFVGDTSHTRFGWDHDVVPGKYTADHAKNAESLAQLRALAKQYPQLRVVLGHE